MAAAAGASAAALPVRPGEKRWTEAELKKVRQQLQEDIAGLIAEISEAESAIAERLGDAVGDAGMTRPTRGPRRTSVSTNSR